VARRFTRRLLATVAALQIVAARQPAVEAAAPAPVQLRDQLTDAQREWWDAWERDNLDAQVMRCGRRAGKSTVLAYWLTDGAAYGPRNSRCIYISITRDHAREILWEALVEAAKLSGRPHVVSESHLSIRFLGAGTVRLAGSDNKKEINKARGKGVLRAAIDECGALKPSLIQYLFESVLEPACMDYNGKIAFAGTPGDTAFGWWYDLSRDGSTLGIPVRRWTARENPHVDSATYFAKTLKKRGWTDEHPTFRREYEAEWITDPGELVFPLDANIDGSIAPTRNTCAALPEKTPAGAWLDPSRWRYSIGIDLGFVHASAFAVVAAHPGLAERWFVLSTEKHVGWLTGQIRDRLRALKTLYPNASVVADTGGYGKPIVEELRRLWSTHVDAADKRDKAGQIRIVRDDVLSGALQVLDGPANDALREEWGVMGWDPDSPTDPNPSAEDHASDATLYARRRLHHYVQDDAPPPKTPQQEAEAERARKFAAFAKANRAKKAAQLAGRSL
jgi:hypothetical protein